MKRKPRPRSPIVGRWRIVEMEQWTPEDCDMEVPAFIEFGRDGSGQFQFILVQGWIDYKIVERDGKPAVEWSWDGSDEMDSASGRGWAVLEPDGRLVGRIYIHQGDDSAFTAKRMKQER
jgi:hypothetical protein